MTTETQQTNYINADSEEQKKRQISKINPTKLDLDLAIFAASEEKEGLRSGSVKTHASMVRTSLQVASERRTIANHRKINLADLRYVEEALSQRGYNHPGSYSRVLAKFVSVVTRKEPIIPLGSLTRKISNPYLLLSAPGIEPRRTLGSVEDRARIEQRFGKDIESFIGSLADTSFSRTTVFTKRKIVYGGIFVYERLFGEFDPAKATSDELDRVVAFVKDFGADSPSKYRTALLQFISFVTGESRDYNVRVKPKDTWADRYEELCPFTKEIERYREIMQAHTAVPGYINARVHIVATIGGMLNERFGVKTIAQLEKSMIDAVLEDVATHVSPTTAKGFAFAFYNFVSYFGRDDLREKSKKRTVQAVFVPRDDCDREFKAKLDEWAEYLKKWQYSEHTYKGRICSVRVCYNRLKEVKGPFRLESLEPFDMQALRNALSEYRETTVQAYLYAFGWFLDFAIGRDLFAESHLWFNGCEVQRNFVQMDEFVKLWEAGSPLDHMILALGGAMGLRRTEMLRMKVSDLKGDMAVIRGKGAGPNGKTMKAEIPKLVKEALEEYLPYREGLVSKFGDRSMGMLLINPYEREICRALTVRSFDTVISKLCEKSEVSFTSHGLRRMFAMNLSDAGLDLDTIRRMMRHSVVDTTLKCYLHADPRKMHGAVGKVNDTFTSVGISPNSADA